MLDVACHLSQTLWSASCPLLPFSLSSLFFSCSSSYQSIYGIKAPFSFAAGNASKRPKSSSAHEVQIQPTSSKTRSDLFKCPSQRYCPSRPQNNTLLQIRTTTLPPCCLIFSNPRLTPSNPSSTPTISGDLSLPSASNRSSQTTSFSPIVDTSWNTLMGTEWRQTDWFSGSSTSSFGRPENPIR